MTNKPATFERSVIRSSVIPSANGCSLAVFDMLVNGKTATDGLSGSRSAILAVDATSAFGAVVSLQSPFQTRTPPASRRRAAAIAAKKNGRYDFSLTTGTLREPSTPMGT